MNRVCAVGLTRQVRLSVSVWCWWWLAWPAAALEPREVAVIVNRSQQQSVELGEYYVKARGVPAENLIALPLPTTEEMTRADYDRLLREPLRQALAERKEQIRCVLLMRGVPLRVGPKEPSPGEKAEIARLQPVLEAAQAKAADADAATAARGKAELARLQTDLIILEHRESTAAVESELMLLWWDNYPLARWQMNPLNWQAGAHYRRGRPPVLMTTRIDGPSWAIARRLIDDALAAEAAGLTGKVVIDARGIRFDPQQPNENGGYGYGGYDESMRETARMFQQAGWEVLLDDQPELLPPQAAAEVAIYCGWYSLGRYVDCCRFTPGAVAWHLASAEAITLRQEDSPVWCPNLLKAGVAATLGPVAEPYAVGFPKPAEFFGFLLTGEFTLAEVHARTLHFTSWMMTCVGDPLYNPFRGKPRLRRAEVFASPRGGQTLFR